MNFIICIHFNNSNKTTEWNACITIKVGARAISKHRIFLTKHGTKKSSDFNQFCDAISLELTPSAKRCEFAKLHLDHLVANHGSAEH